MKRSLLPLAAFLVVPVFFADTCLAAPLAQPVCTDQSLPVSVMSRADASALVEAGQIGADDVLFVSEGELKQAAFAPACEAHVQKAGLAARFVVVCVALTCIGVWLLHGF